ncbi:MAG TPA: acetamidase, partial [Firmicutes bacterium]|nr:acetamidase [Bacillota bacterium]
MYFLSSEKHIYKFSRDAAPALTVKTGELVRLETMDCFSNQIKAAEDKLESVQRGINPATGPIYVTGAEKGDTLKITVMEIKVSDRAVILAGKDMGLLGHKLEGKTIKVVPIINGELFFSENIRLPLESM